MTSARDIQAPDANDLVASCRELIATRGLEEIVVAGADTNGILRGKRIPAERFADDPTAGVAAGDLVFALDARGEIVPRPADVEARWPSPETSGFADVVLVPDLTTLRALPWTDTTAIVVGDFRQVDGGEVAASPQAVLRRVVERATRLGLHPRMAAELEFFILSRPAAEGYLTLSPGEDDFLLRALTDHLGALGLEVLASNREGGPGQYEITIGHTGLPQAAVDASLLKYAVKDVAQIHRARVTFMSKPTDSIFGSGCHLHQSLLSEDGGNLFFDPDAAGGLSKVASSYIAGQLATLPDFTAIWSSTPNAYKRRQPYSGASVAWAFENRAAALRVAAPDAERCRIELRAPGGDERLPRDGGGARRRTPRDRVRARGAGAEHRPLLRGRRTPDRAEIAIGRDRPLRGERGRARVPGRGVRPVLRRYPPLGRSSRSAST